MMYKSFRKSAAIASAVAGVATLGAMTRASDPTDNASTVYMIADLSAKILYVHGTDSVGYYDISTGKDGYPTPTGNFKIRKLTWNPSWTPPDSKWAAKKKPAAPGDPKNPMKVVKIFFKEPDYYIHGTADVGSLGYSESHGCLRMAPDDVMKVGMWVMQHGGQPQEENWFMRLIHSRNEEKVVYLSKPVSIRVQQ